MPQFNPLQMLMGRPRPQAPRPMANNPLDLFSLQGQFGDEAELNAAQAVQAGQDPAAWDRKAKFWDQGRAETYAGMQPSEGLQDISSAINEGFGGGMNNPMQRVADQGDLTGAPVYEQSQTGMNPVQQRNIYKRSMEQEKMRQPIAQTAMQQAGETQRQNIATQGQKDVAKMELDASATNYDNYQELIKLMQGGGNTGRAIDSATLPTSRGGGSFNFVNDPNVPNQTSTLNQLAVIRGNLAKVGIQNPFQNFAAPTTQDEANFVQSVNGILSQTRFSDPQVKTDISDYLRNPQTAMMPFDQLFELPENPTAADLADFQAAMDFFIKVRGQ